MGVRAVRGVRGGGFRGLWNVVSWDCWPAGRKS